jgi:solute carrier family 35 (adenosine 3'-phospho 5'-phosphosulfate transporter), member B2
VECFPQVCIIVRCRVCLALFLSIVIFFVGTFCVFSNRALAIVVAFVACMWRHGSVQSAASWLSFSPPALSNTVSSWAQYESLAYVSFPLQNLFKSTKLIPVMIMGRFLNGTIYSMTEIVEALVISAGVLVFSMGKGNSASGRETTSVHGLILLCTYVVADSFTSQYQSSIYKQYGKVGNCCCAVAACRCMLFRVLISLFAVR